MNVTLPDELEVMLNEQVRSGRFASPAEVIREGLRLLNDQQARLDMLRRDIGEAIAQADNGEVSPSEEVFQRLRQRNANSASQR